MANTEKLGQKEENITLENENSVKNFFQNNQKVIYGILIGILVVIAACLALYKFYFMPRAERASEAMYGTLNAVCVNGVLANDSLTLTKALEGDDEIDGFLSVIDGYKGTKAANTAKYWAGLCYLALDNKEEAAEMLQGFKKKENFMWYKAQLLLGDLADDQGDVENAKKYYNTAIKGETAAVAPEALWKLGMLAERDGNWAEAFDCYQQIKDNYEVRYEQMGVDKYYERAKVNAGK